MFLTVAWSLVLAGGLGNLLDRLIYDGRVIDFMNLGIGSLRTGIFNVADVCITIGSRYSSLRHCAIVPSGFMNSHGFPCRITFDAWIERLRLTSGRTFPYKRSHGNSDKNQISVHVEGRA